MNSISWFIYLSDVAQNIGIALFIGGVLAVGAAGACCFFAAMEDWETTPSAARSMMYFAMPAILISCLIHGKTTMYAMAASQLGETVITSPEGKEMIDDTKQILRDYLKSLKKESSK
jgi:hypothetical protein